MGIFELGGQGLGTAAPAGRRRGALGRRCDGGGRGPRLSRRVAACGVHWEVHGMGHARSGGSARDSHADPTGPNASAAMPALFQQVDQRTSAHR